MQNYLKMKIAFQECLSVTMMVMIHLIIFDLDGTLVDSSQDITNAINHAVAGTGLPPYAREQIIKLVGEGLTKLIENILPPELEHRKAEILQKFLDYYSEHIADNTRPYPSVCETLKKLGKYRKAVLSNKHELLSKRLMGKINIIKYFDYIIGSDTLNERKPSPKAIHYLLDTFSLLPENAMIVGDSELDIRAGKNARITTVGVTYGYRQSESLKDADYLINAMSELIPLLGT